MDFEVLKKSRLKRNIIISIMVVAIICAVIVNFTKAKYRVTESIPLVNGTINYELSDLNLIGLYIKNSDEYTQTDEIPSTGYLFNEEKSYCKIGSEVQENMTITYDMKTKNLTISPMTIKGTKCYLYFDAPTNIEELLATKTIETRNDFTQTLESDTTGIVYEAEDNEGTTYVYAGAPTDNWVKFGKWSEDTPDVYFGSYNDVNVRESAQEFLTKEECDQVYNNCRLISRAGKDMYWRIIRINGNGSLRLIYAGTTPIHLNNDSFIGTSAFNEQNNDNAYVGYMYGTPGSSTYEETHANINDSTIKEFIDEWYEKNMLSHSFKIDIETGFCGDRIISPWSSSNPQSGTGQVGTYYHYYGGYDLDVEPSLKCESDNDYYTVNNLGIGNEDLKYPVGLINFMEAIYAGYSYANSNPVITNSNMYLYTTYCFKTMTPAVYNANRNLVSVFHINTRDNGEGYTSSSTTDMILTVRPVLNLKPDITFTSGDGTSSNPFVVSN